MTVSAPRASPSGPARSSRRRRQAVAGAGKHHEIGPGNGVRGPARCVIEDTIGYRAAGTVAGGRPSDDLPLPRQFRGAQRTGHRAADQTEPEEADAHRGEYRSRHVRTADTNAIEVQRQPRRTTSCRVAATDHQPTRSERRSSVRRSATRRSCPSAGPGYGRIVDPPRLTASLTHPSSTSSGDPHRGQRARRARERPGLRPSRGVGRIAGRRP